MAQIKDKAKQMQKLKSSGQLGSSTTSNKKTYKYTAPSKPSKIDYSDPEQRYAAPRETNLSSEEKDRIDRIYEESVKDKKQRQRQIMESMPVRQGNFANIFQEGSQQKKELDKLGYKVSEDGNYILTEDGGTIASITDIGQLSSGSRAVTDLIKNYEVEGFGGRASTDKDKRAETTYGILGRLEGLDEPSLYGQEKLSKVLDYGRGLATSSTGIVGQPTYVVGGGGIGDVFGDIGRGLFGGKAEQQIPGMRQSYDPRRVKGLIPTLVEGALEGKLSPIALGIKAVNTAITGFNTAYDKMNDVAKEIFENKGKYSYAENMPSVREAEDASMRLLNAQQTLDNLKERQLFQDYKSRFMDPLMQAETEPTLTGSAFESIVPEYQKSSLVTGEPVRDIKVLPPEDQTVLEPFPGEEKVQTEEKTSFFDSLFPDVEAAEMGTQVTSYNNPGNLKFANQASAIQGQTYGPGYAVFPTAEAGLEALRADLTAKVNRSNKVEDIIGEYAPRSDNPESFDNYIGFVKDRVGDTVEPNEMNDLVESVIRFENKPEVADKYLNVLGGTSALLAADGGMIDRKLKSLQNGLQNMYNGIPSVRRR